MRRASARIAAGTCTFVLVLGGFTHAAEVAVDSVPKPVAETVAARYPGIEITEYAQETTPEGDIVYEVSLERKGKNIDLTLTPEGILTLIENEISRKELPKPVQEKLDAEYPRARFRIVEEVIAVEGKEEKLQYYEVRLETKDEQTWAVELSASGEVLKVEKKMSDEEEEED